MALRRYSDRSGRDWNVWNVQPPASEHVQETLREGWLCFQCPDGGDRYRLPMSDVPPTWEDLPEERLELLRRVAALGPSTEPMRRAPLPEQPSDDVELLRPSPSV
jgi:hypothetical protein